MNSEEIVMRENKIKEPIIFSVIEPNTKANYMNIFKALRSIYEKEPSFKVYTKDQTKYVIIAGVKEETLQIVIEALRKEFNIEFKSGDTQIIYKQTIKNSIKSEGRYIRQCGGSNMHDYIVKSNRESGNGRSDIYIKSPSIFDPAVIMELKICKEPKDIYKMCDEALKQIEKNKYIC